MAQARLLRELRRPGCRGASGLEIEDDASARGGAARSEFGALKLATSTQLGRMGRVRQVEASSRWSSYNMRLTCVFNESVRPNAHSNQNPVRSARPALSRWLGSAGGADCRCRPHAGRVRARARFAPDFAPRASRSRVFSSDASNACWTGSPRACPEPLLERASSARGCAHLGWNMHVFGFGICIVAGR